MLRMLRVNTGCARTLCLFSAPESCISGRLGRLNLLKCLHLVDSLKHCRGWPYLGKTMGWQLGPPCPAHKLEWLPIVYGAKSKCQAWYSSAGPIGPRPVFRTLSSGSTSCPRQAQFLPAPEPQSPHLPSTWTSLVPQTLPPFSSPVFWG